MASQGVVVDGLERENVALKARLAAAEDVLRHRPNAVMMRGEWAAGRFERRNGYAMLTDVAGSGAAVLLDEDAARLVASAFGLLGPRQ